MSTCYIVVLFPMGGRSEGHDPDSQGDVANASEILSHNNSNVALFIAIPIDIISLRHSKTSIPPRHVYYIRTHA